MIVEMEERAEAADEVIDAAELSAIPGLVDGLVHSTFGKWMPAQNSMWGNPADLVLCGPVKGTRGNDAPECLALGNLPGISALLVDGVPLVSSRSEQTPPPTNLAKISDYS